MTKTPSTSESFPHWIYDGSPIEDPFGYGQRAVDFVRSLKHPQSKLPGKPLIIPMWVERYLMRVYGPRHPDGTRIVKTVVLLLPRGSGKTTFASAQSLLHLLGPERRPFGQSILAASDRSQAGIAFMEARGIVECDKRLFSATKIYDAHNSRKKLDYRKIGSSLEVISADGGKQHGRTISFALCDELHVWKGRDLWQAIQTGVDKVDDSLLVIATTAGTGQTSVAYEKIEEARKIARGEIVDPSILPVLFEADPDCDWRNEELWHKVMPGLAHGLPPIGGVRRHARRAERSMSELRDFLQLKLNVWQDASKSPFVNMSVYDEGAAPFDLQDMKGLPCWLGVDLSWHGDLTALVACWRAEDDTYFVHPWFFAPRGNLDERERMSKLPYKQWEKDGLIEIHEGRDIDHGLVEKRIRQLCEDFDVQQIAFDPAHGRDVMNHLVDDGLPVVQHRQIPGLMMPAISATEHIIVGGRFRHGGHKLLRSNFANVEVEKTGYGDKSKLTKSEEWLSIDGATATVMAVGLASLGEVRRSIYESPDFDPSMMVLA
ncbi:terminase large subunit [Labrys sp. 22185]|uniref:terminase large subunit n=1 Tax=Labrys sp. 22185 TaxID=3453888 RepID=UPI003F83F88E